MDSKFKEGNEIFDVNTSERIGKIVQIIECEYACGICLNPFRYFIDSRADDVCGQSYNTETKKWSFYWRK